MWIFFGSSSCKVNQHTRWLLVHIILLWYLRLCRGLSIKSMQIWSQVDANGDFSLPAQVYAFNVPQAEASVAGTTGTTTSEFSGVGARQAISRWTSVGCFTSTNIVYLNSQSGVDPLHCTIHCGLVGDAVTVAVMRGSTCYCLADRASIARADTNRCDSPCPTYFNKAVKFCGGLGDYYWAYQKYEFVHQTAQGCYDPWRFLWYQSVIIEVITTVNGVKNATKEFYLHASSINSGDPIFPYHQQLDHMLLGLQYDLDDSRLVGWVAPTWHQKTDASTSWSPYLEVYKIRSLNDDVKLTKEVITFSIEDSSAASYLFSNGVSSIDAINNIYYVVLPSVLQVPDGTKHVYREPEYTTKLYGINIEATTGDREVLNQNLQFKVVLLECNAKYHDLFALLGDTGVPSGFYYTRLGHTYRNNRTNVVEFNWTFVSPVASVVNPHNYKDFLPFYYQIGATTVDHVSNKSLVVYKELPNADSPYVIADIDQNGFLTPMIKDSVPSPAVQGTWLVNTDPMIPLSLPAPKLLYARFTLDGQRIVVQFDSFTIEGARPLDTDGDFIPDDIDLSKKQEGVRNCSDMFARQTASLLASARCVWSSGATIQIYVDRDFDAIGVGDGIFLEDSTIYAYLAEKNEWSNAASGGIQVGLPDPLPAPTIDVSYPSTVDLCAGVTLNAEKSSGDGGRPVWTWTLKKVPSCTLGRPPTSSITDSVNAILADASAGGLTLNGVDLVSFGRDDLEPGCTYTINVKLLGRWAKQSDKDLTIIKRDVPAPQVSLAGPRHIHQFRSKKISLQALVTTSDCESQLVQLRTLKYEWTASVEREDEFSQALKQQPVILSDLSIRTGSALLIIPKLSLEPEATYTMTVQVGYEETWTVAGTSTNEEVKVTIVRSNIKVNVRGGSRKVEKTNFVAIDARDSFDPDYPTQLVEKSQDWSFSYTCTAEDGSACFQLNSLSSTLPDVKDCSISAEGQEFEDLENKYPLPSFQATALTSDTYYCRDPNRVGILILNLPSGKALPQGNYTFTVIANAHGRTASTSIILQVTWGQIAGPRVLITPLEQPKISITQTLRVEGHLMDADREKYADIVTFSWVFFKEEANPRYSNTAKLIAEQNNQPYLETPRIVIRAPELTSKSFDSAANSNNLVVLPNQLHATTKYFFRLIATAPHPSNQATPLVGYTELDVQTAGPAPVPGELIILPLLESVSYDPTTEKTFQAQHWSAEDVPLTYMFSYKVGLKAEFPIVIDLKADSYNAPTQTVKCLKAGLAVDNYKIQVNVTVTSNYGAATSATQLYISKPPANEFEANSQLLKLAEKVDSDTSTVILNCVSIPEVSTSENTPTYTCGQGNTAQCSLDYKNGQSGNDFTAFCNTCAEATGERCALCCETCLNNQNTATTTTAAVPFETTTEDTSDVEHMVDIMTAAVKSTAATSSNVNAKLAIADEILSKGHQPANMMGLLKALVDEVNNIAGSGDESAETVDTMLQHVFTTFGQYGLTAAGKSDTAETLNAADPNGEYYFPSGAGGRRLHRTSYDRKWHEQRSRLDGRPDWQTLPFAYRDPFFSRTDPAERGRSLTQATVNDAAQQELKEQEWISYINATLALKAYSEQQAALDDEYFANYSAHLGAAEREIVTREWWQERARKESQAAQNIYTQSQITSQMFHHISGVCSTLIKHMVTGEHQKDFSFPMGTISVGKTRNLVNSGTAFHLQDSKWKISGEVTGAYGYEYIKFDRVNPLSWDPDGPAGPYLVSSLEVFRDDGTAIPVEHELQPITIMDDHSSFASASCYVWDWQANNGLGGWSLNGVLNNGKGCVSTHLSIVGLFLDVVSPDDGIELPSAVDSDFVKTVTDYNTVVIVALSGGLVLCGLLHFWGLKQDEQDRTKPMEMKKLGDGITKPRSQDDPVNYSHSACGQTCGTFWNLIRRDHNFISCFCRCPKMKTTRLQKVSTLFATICGTSAVCALFYGEHIINSKHYIEVGIIASVLTYPMIRMMRLMFSSRPYREAGASNQPGIFNVAAPPGDPHQPLQAIPVPAEEQEDEDFSPPDRGGFTRVAPPMQGGPLTTVGVPLALTGDPNLPNPLNPVPNLPNPLNPAPNLPNPLNGAPNMSPPRVNLSLPPVQAHSPNTVSGGSGPEEGGGPQLPFTAQVLSGSMPAPPPPPAPVTSCDGLPPLPPPSDSPRAEMPSSALMRAVTEQLDSERIGDSTTPLPPVRPPPMPPLTVARDNDEAYQLALLPSAPPDESIGLSPILPPATESGAIEAAQSSAQVRSYNRVRRMIIEKVCNDAERLAYDERIDMRSSVPHPMAHVATALAYTAVVSYWVTALILTVEYAVHLSSRDALRWLYACLFSWGFTWFVLEGVKTVLVTILELQQLNMRRRVRDQGSLQRQVSMKKALKLKQMEVLSKATGVQQVVPMHQSMQPRLPLPASSSTLASSLSSVVPAAANFPDEGLAIVPNSESSQPPSRADESAG